MPKFIELTGQRIGKLVVLRRVENKGKCVCFLCACDCGKEKIIRSKDLTKGHGEETKSCGCILRLSISKRTRKGKGEHGLNRFVDNYRRGAEVRGLRFELTNEEIRGIVTSDCFYCGASPSMVTTYGPAHSKRYSEEAIRHAALTHNGIDRLDNSVGYVKENCVSCCKRCNYMKHTMSVEEFKEQVKRIVTHLSL
jgi:hypothetical protein